MIALFTLILKIVKLFNKLASKKTNDNKLIFSKNNNNNKIIRFDIGDSNQMKVAKKSKKFEKSKII